MTYRIKNTLDSEHEFFATYKGYQVHVEWQGDVDEQDGEVFEEPPLDGMAYYIVVRNPEISFGTAYEGYWGDARNSLEEAVEEALVGSCLIADDQRKFGPGRAA